METETDQPPGSNIQVLTKLTHDLIKSTHGAWSIHDIDETELESFFEFLFYSDDEDMSDQLFI